MPSSNKEFDLPPLAVKLTESASVALLSQIKRYSITTSLGQTITTTYVRQGSGGIPIVLLHGFDSSVLEFRRLLPLLAADNETWAIDLLGFGFTERPVGIAYGTDAIKVHLYHFWKTLLGQPVILVGASMGGATALDFTLTYPEAVAKLVLIDSAGLAKPTTMGKFMFFPLTYLATEFLKNAKIRQKIGRVAYFDRSFASLDAYTCGALHLNSPNWSQALIAFTKSGGYGSFAPRLSDIRQPTLILWGRHDKILGTKDAARFKQAIPSSELIWIEDCGHVPHLEKPQTTAQYILNFRNLVFIET